MARLTTRPRYVKGEWEGYEPWRNRWVDTLTNLRPFTSASALRGTVENPGDVSLPFGTRLPAEYRDSVRFADYVVWSYETPIAWHLTGLSAKVAGGEWVVPVDTYTPTTSHHIGMILGFIPESLTTRPGPFAPYQNPGGERIRPARW